MYIYPPKKVYKANPSINDIDSISEPAEDVSFFIKIYGDSNDVEYKYLNGDYEILNSDV